MTLIADLSQNDDIIKLTEKLQASAEEGVVIQPHEVGLILTALTLLVTERENQFCLAMKAEAELSTA